MLCQPLQCDVNVGAVLAADAVHAHLASRDGLQEWGNRGRQQSEAAESEDAWIELG